MARRSLFAIIALAATLHAVGIARTRLPAQDGLKFIRIARQFAHQPWFDVVRGADQHPLYPALIAAVEPCIAPLARSEPDAWRIAAQTASALASIVLLLPLFSLTRTLFNERVALLAVLVYVLLPFPAEIGHDALSDPLALCCFLLALRLGEIALRGEGWAAPIGCGLVAGVGYLARPEILVAPAAVLVTAATHWRAPSFGRPRMVPRFAALGVAFLTMVGTYAMVKGEVSEKLALRQGTALGSNHHAARLVKQWLPSGLDDPGWDFSPKEENLEENAGARASGLAILGRVMQQWAEGLAWIFALFAIWGLVRDRHIRSALGREAESGAGPGRRLIAIYLILFSAVLVRHAWKLGYLSGRHTLTLLIVSIPWAAAALDLCARRLSAAMGWSDRRSRRLGAVALTLLIASGAYVQQKPTHASRWGHWAAGRWLSAHAKTSDSVLDTRGWAAFVSGRPNYDYWHVRQAFTDARLAYVVVGSDELAAESRRAATLRAVLAYAAEPVAEFSEREGGGRVGVRVYRYRRPRSWEALRP